MLNNRNLVQLTPKRLHNKVIGYYYNNYARKVTFALLLWSVGHLILIDQEIPKSTIGKFAVVK